MTRSRSVLAVTCSFIGPSLRRAAVAAIVALGLVVTGCGGGDGAPAVSPNVTIAAGGTVTSDDGQVRLVVAPNSASAEAAGSIAKAPPTAEMLADPSYVPDSAYTYQGPDLEFEPPASWELASPHAVAAARLDRKSPLGTAAADVDVERLCVPAVAQGAGLSARSVWVRGGTCPTGCTALRAPGAPALVDRTLCAPRDDVQVATLDVACPAGTVDASDEPAWSSWATANAARVCVGAPAIAAPVLGTSLAGATTSCSLRAGKFACNPPKVTSGLNIGLFFDGEPPKNVILGFRPDWKDDVDPDRLIPGAFTILVPDGATGKLFFFPKAEEVAGGGIGNFGLQIREHKLVTPALGGVSLIALASTVVWEAAPPYYNGGVPGSLTTAVPAVVEYKWNDPPVRYFRAKAWDQGGNVAYSSFLRISRLSPTAPVIASFVAAPNALPLGGGSTLLTWDVNGADAVKILPAIGFVAANGSSTAIVHETTTYTLSAGNASGQTVTKSVIVTVAEDTTPPALTLTPSAATVIVPANATLTATASDAGGIAKVEFYRGTTLVATDTAAPYQYTVSFTAFDVGTPSFTARAYDVAGNVATSAPVTIAVTDPPGNGDTWASPTGVDIGNTTCAQASPCLTIAKAASLAQPSKTVWLLNGDYTSATQPALIAIPATRTLRAVNAGLARVSQGIALQGGGSVVGVVVARTGFGDIGSIQASSGVVTIDGVRVIGSLAAPSGSLAPISLSGSAQATMTPGSIADYGDQLAPIGQGEGTYATIGGSARLIVSGGMFGGAALGGGNPIVAGGQAAFRVSESGRLDLVNAVVGVDTNGVQLSGPATQLHMTGSLLTANANTGIGYGIHAVSGAAQISLTNSSVVGFSSIGAGSAGIAVGAFNLPGVAATIAVSTGGVTGSDTGIYTTDGTTSSSLTITGSNLVVGINRRGGIECRSACSIDVNGGEISDNGSIDPVLTGSHSFFGGIWMGSARPHFLKLRNVHVTGNTSAPTGNTNVASNSGLTLGGTAGSAFDLGSTASPGNNVFGGNATGNETSSINVQVAPGITVRATGNSFAPNVQGANALGRYQLGTAPCGPSSCDLTSTASSGANFRIASGVLRLAE
jgi:hypothetical protein